ncbi:hypothetical protein DFP72DRAFT_854581 [Ephemerocybe angulata]|uniref:Uncharacterized protein n=1 Tax=Ephemerocybe angulata TaxID=980116 RepID=A0A8H6HI93_9AGAR|nr:hypothetical protein DFP72DRAFT_854581 [Tulosesus angulatus]
MSLVHEVCTAGRNGLMGDVVDVVQRLHNWGCLTGEASRAQAGPPWGLHWALPVMVSGPWTGSWVDGSMDQTVSALRLSSGEGDVPLVPTELLGAISTNCTCRVTRFWGNWGGKYIKNGSHVTLLMLHASTRTAHRALENAPQIHWPVSRLMVLILHASTRTAHRALENAPQIHWPVSCVMLHASTHMCIAHGKFPKVPEASRVHPSVHHVLENDPKIHRPVYCVKLHASTRLCTAHWKMPK